MESLITAHEEEIAAVTKRDVTSKANVLGRFLYSSDCFLLEMTLDSYLPSKDVEILQD